MRKLFVVLVSAALLASAGLAGQSKPKSLEGAWQAVEVTVTGPNARTITIPEPRPNLIILTARHYGRVEIHADGRRPVPADVTTASADELRAVWGPFVGEAGTYEVTNGNLITMRPIVAKNPVAMAPGAFSTYSYELDANTVVLTARTNQSGPIANPVTVKAVRVE